MAAISGQLQTYNLGNYVGELYMLTPQATPFASMAAANGVQTVQANRFTWTVADNTAASQDVKAEGDDATFSGRDTSPRTNVVQIHQEGVEISYSKMADSQSLADSAYTGISTDAPFLLGTPNASNTLAWQLMMKMDKIARDVDYSFINGTFNDPADNTATNRKTRGILAATALSGGNTIPAGGAALSKDLIDQMIRDLVDAGAPMNRMVVWVNSYLRQQFSAIYAYEPESRTMAGVRIDTILTDFGTLNIGYDRHMPTTTALFAEMSVVRPVHRPIPGKGIFFTEQLAKTGSAEKYQVYGEIGLNYGPHEWHGTITGLDDGS